MIAIMSNDLDALWCRAAQRREFAAGEALFRSGDPVRVLYRVEEGVVNLVRVLAHGGMLTLQRATDGALLAEASIFAKAYHCDAVARSTVRVSFMPVAALGHALRSGPELCRSLAQHLANEVQRARARAEIVALRTVSERLDAWLALQDNPLPARGRWRELADEIAVSPEALYRELASRRAST
jgi:CRP-like cAMP-binding protein